jgi:hypothetical protein
MTMPIHPDPAKLLADTGLLYQLNHEVLHPFGMALVLKIDDDGTSRVAGVWATSDVEGIVFDEAALADGQAKLEAFMAGPGALRHAARRAALGYIVQPPAVSMARPVDRSEGRPMAWWQMVAILSVGLVLAYLLLSWVVGGRW